MRASSERLSMSSKQGESCRARVKSLMTSKSAEPINSTSRVWSSRMKSRSLLERFSLNWSRSIAVSMARNTSGPRMSAKESDRSLASQSSKFAAGLVLADEAGEKFLQRFQFAAGNQGMGHFAGELGGNAD